MLYDTYLSTYCSHLNTESARILYINVPRSRLVGKRCCYFYPICDLGYGGSGDIEREGINPATKLLTCGIPL